MKINHRCFQPHRHVGMATGRALKKDGRNLGGQEQKIVCQPMNKLRHRFVVGVDAADGFARLVLQGCERAPFVNLPLWFRANIQRNQPDRNETGAPPERVVPQYHPKCRELGKEAHG